MTEKIKVEGIFLRDDYSEIITESFAKRYYVDISRWITPFGYYDEFNQSIICDNSFQDGTYILLGKMSYPGNNKMSYYTILQFNMIKSRGLSLDIATEFNVYPDVPKILPFSPKYPLFRVGSHTEFKNLLSEFKEIQSKHWTMDEVLSKLNNLTIDTTIGKIWGLKLALLRDLNRGK
jgi:hypothetical protein